MSGRNRQFKIRVVLERPAEIAGFAIACAGHLALGLTVFIMALRGGSAAGAAARPSMSVMLATPRGAIAAHGSAPVQSQRAAREPAPVVPPRPNVARAVVEKPKPVPRKKTAGPAPTAPESPPAAPETAPPDREAARATDPPPGLPAGPIAGGVAGLDTGEGPDLGEYADRVSRLLSGAWSDRPLVPQGYPAQRVTIAFTIERDGTITDLVIKTPSGYDVLDDSALRAVTGLRRLPRLPSYLHLDRVPAAFVFELLPPDAQDH